MTRLIVACGVLVLGVAAAAQADNVVQSAGYFPEAGAPLVTPSAKGEPSDTTAQKQQNGGYYPEADAPIVPPTHDTIGADSTARKQAESGYFPEAGAPLVSPDRTGVR